MSFDTIRRRKFLRYASAAAVAGLAGCMGDGSDGNGTENGTDIGQIGENPYYNVGDRPAPGGTPMSEMPDLSGELRLYLGRGEGGLYQDLLDFLQDTYDDFNIVTKHGNSASLANTILEESQAGSSPADVFWSIDAGSLGIVAENGYARALPDDVLGMVGTEFRSDSGYWIGTAGRARSVPYNTNEFSADEIPGNVTGFAESGRFENALGWAPSYGAFQAFVTAMRVLNGETATKDWLNGIMDQGVTKYPNEFVLSQAIADGEVGAGFANHYYALRVQNARRNAPIKLAFTQNDAGALVNVAGASVVKPTENYELASNFIRHLLSSEAQEFFATTTFAYPLISGVAPVGDLPPIDELNPPNLDLTELSDIQPTLELMREVGIRV